MGRMDVDDGSMDLIGYVEWVGELRVSRMDVDEQHVTVVEHLLML